MSIALVISAFVAGLLTFFAPCTLPLVPGYLGFISGVSSRELQTVPVSPRVRQRIFLNGLFYVAGFSFIFILLGLLFGLGGAAFVRYRIQLSQLGGLVVIFFGLYMILSQFPLLAGWRWLRFLQTEKHFPLRRLFVPGHPLSSFLFGAVFAFGWSPCIGPILATVLFLASHSATIVGGGFLLSIFSLGLAIPFLLVAWGVGTAFTIIHRLGPLLRLVSVTGGIFLMFIGLLLLSNSFDHWIAYFYQLFSFLNYDKILNYL